jgi:hypothetical protein
LTSDRIRSNQQQKKRHTKRPTDYTIIAASTAAPRETRGQTPGIVDKGQAQYTRSKGILEDIKKLKDSYGQDKSRDARLIPYGITTRLF